MKSQLVHATLFLLSLLLSSCGMRRSSPSQSLLAIQNLDLRSLQSFRLNRFFEGPQAYLVIPNPIDSAQLKAFDFSQTDFQRAQVGVGLPNLQAGSSLDNSFLKVRVRSQFDSADLLLSPRDLATANSSVQDQKYSQAMAYHAITSIEDYVKALGFTLDKSRPLYVFVRSNPNPEQASAVVPSTEINALYSHNLLQPQKPRYIQLFGDVQYPLGSDRDVYWHEFGHLFNESITASRGMDEAGDQGAIYTEGSALHECLADYLAESASQKGYIGRWAARNLPKIQPYYPLRAALSLNDDKNRFSSVATYQANQGSPEKYDVAEWCSRVLWDIRTRFESEDKESGAFFSDRMIFSAAGILPKNASLMDFKKALIESDRILNQGVRHSWIQSAFNSRGFPEKGASLGLPLRLRVSPMGFKEYNNQIYAASPNSNADEIFFSILINNPNGGTARNVRLQIVSSDPAVIPYVGIQGYGDLSAGASIQVSGSQYKDFLGSVSLALDRRYAVGRTRVRFNLKVLSENAPETIIPVELSL